MTDELETQEPEEPSGSALRSELEKTKQQNKDQAEQIAKLTQENSISKAGLSELPVDKLEALMAVTKGEITPEVLRQKALGLGFIEETPEVPNETVDAQNALNEIRAGADTGGASTKDDEIRAARNPQELEAVLQKHNVPVGSVI